MAAASFIKTRPSDGDQHAARAHDIVLRLHSAYQQALLAWFEETGLRGRSWMRGHCVCLQGTQHTLNVAASFLIVQVFEFAIDKA